VDVRKYPRLMREWRLTRHRCFRAHQV
jgi:hypothetical protein